MKLYRCITPTDSLCACGKAAKALKAAGHEFETERVALSKKPEKRPQVMELTGQTAVPVVVLDDGTAIHDSQRIVEHFRAGASGTG